MKVFTSSAVWVPIRNSNGIPVSKAIVFEYKSHALDYGIIIFILLKKVLYTKTLQFYTSIVNRNSSTNAGKNSRALFLFPSTFILWRYVISMMLSCHICTVYEFYCFLVYEFIFFWKFNKYLLLAKCIILVFDEELKKVKLFFIFFCRNLMKYQTRIKCHFCLKEWIESFKSTMESKEKDFWILFIL